MELYFKNKTGIRNHMWLSFLTEGINWYGHWYLIASSLQRHNIKSKDPVKLFLSDSMHVLSLGSSEYKNKK